MSVHGRRQEDADLPVDSRNFQASEWLRPAQDPGAGGWEGWLLTLYCLTLKPGHTMTMLPTSWSYCEDECVETAEGL